MSNQKHTAGPWTAFVAGKWDYTIRAADGSPVVRLSDYFGHSQDEREANARLVATSPELLALVARLALATNEGDDQAQGTHYVDKQGLIRCKGSFLSLIEDARAAVAKATT